MWDKEVRLNFSMNYWLKKINFFWMNYWLEELMKVRNSEITGLDKESKRR